MLARHQGFAAQEKRHAVHVHYEAMRPRRREGVFEIWRFEKAIDQANREKALAQLFHRDAPRRRHHRRIGHRHRCQHHAFMQHTVMLQTVQHGIGNNVAARAHEDGGARYALAIFVGAGQEQIQRQGIVSHLFQMQPPSHPPGVHQDKDHSCGGQWQPAAFQNLQAVGSQESHVNQSQYAEQRINGGPRPLPAIDGDHADQHGGNHHYARHRDAIGGGQRGGRFEDQHDQHHANAQHDIDAGHINLSFLGRRGVADFHARQLAQLHRLAGDGKDAADHRLAGDDGGHRGQRHHRVMRPAWHHGVEQEARGGWPRQQQRALAEIIQQQGGQREIEPGPANGAGPEMAHIGIQRLAARHRQHHRTQRHKSRPGLAQEQAHAIHRIDGAQDLRRLENGGSAQHTQHDEPQHHHRSEQLADCLGAAALDQEQSDQDHQGQWHDKGRKTAVADTDAFQR